MKTLNELGITPGLWRVGFDDGSGMGNSGSWPTEGAWITREDDPDYIIVRGGRDELNEMGVVGGYLGCVTADVEAQMKANARLIAQSPALYEALRELVDMEDNRRDYSFLGRMSCIEKAKAALHAAGGSND